MTKVHARHATAPQLRFTEAVPGPRVRSISEDWKKVKGNGDRSKSLSRKLRFHHSISAGSREASVRSVQCPDGGALEAARRGGHGRGRTEAQEVEAELTSGFARFRAQLVAAISSKRYVSGER